VKVLHVIYEFSPGGAERVVATYAKFLDKNRFDVSVCALTVGGHYEDDLAQNGVRLFILGKKRRFDPSVLAKLTRLLRSENIDIVHFHDISSSLWGTIPAVLARVKAVIRTVHNVRIVGSDLFSQVKAKTAWLAFPFHHKLIAVSAEVEKTHINANPFFSKKHIVIHNGVDPSSFDITLDRDKYLREFGLREKSLIIGTIGRFAPQKAQEIFLAAIQIVLNKRNDVGVLMVGDGPRREELVALCANLGLENGVVFTGVRRDVPQILHLMDIFVLSSDWEGFPMTILEAMACGKPVVATDVGGNREAVVEGETGFLLRARDVSGIAEAILKLIRDPKMRKEMGKKARERFLAHFTAEAMVRETERVYEQLLSR
jgi:glycosyltransferase involved in cell wall biosynthesis